MAGGGTGGHIIPALNIAKALRKVDEEAEFIFVGTKRGLETSLVPKAGFQLKLIEAKPWKGFKAVFALFKGVLKSLSIIKKFRPNALIGTGGYVSAPAILAAAMSGVPIFLQEQNSYPGLATRFGSVFARKVFLGFDEAKKYLWRKKFAIHTGNPITHMEMSEDKSSCREKFGLSPSLPTVLLTGGSQGSSPLNTMMRLMIEEVGFPQKCQLLWQCGKRDFEDLRNWIAKRKEPIKILDFIDDMWSAYRASDLVVCRAGAITLAEIAAAGLPAIIVPYPYAAGNHQSKNAIVFAEKGAAIVIEQHELTPKILYETIDGLLRNKKKLDAMSKAMLEIAKPNASQVIAEFIYAEIRGDSEEG